MNKDKLLSKQMLDQLKIEIGEEMIKVNVHLNEDLIRMFWNAALDAAASKIMEYHTIGGNNGALEIIKLKVT